MVLLANVSQDIWEISVKKLICAIQIHV